MRGSRAYAREVRENKGSRTPFGFVARRKGDDETFGATETGKGNTMRNSWMRRIESKLLRVLYHLGRNNPNPE